MNLPIVCIKVCLLHIFLQTREYTAVELMELYSVS